MNKQEYVQDDEKKGNYLLNTMELCQQILTTGKMTSLLQQEVLEKLGGGHQG